ncbi:MAG: hypothetical protein ACREOM_04380 [Candidatus Dormibacteraceae bacterium]
MQSEPGSFSWSEDLDEALNYWFWLRRHRANLRVTKVLLEPSS